MQLVLLAAGYGTRFGGVKQLAPVGPNGEAIMDYTASFANARGFDGAIVIIREEIEQQMRSHIASHWPSGLPVEFVYQPSTRGTAPAVLAAAKYATGPFAVANADDLYGDAALALFPEHFSTSSPNSSSFVDDRHLLVAYRLANTVLASSHVKRGLCELNENGELQRISECEITVYEANSFESVPFLHEDDPNKNAPVVPSVLTGAECVSMNLWGFHDRIFDDLDNALANHMASPTQSPELLLPEVIEQLVASQKETVRVVVTEANCIGITSRDDLDVVRSQLQLLTTNVPDTR